MYGHAQHKLNTCYTLQYQHEFWDSSAIFINDYFQGSLLHVFVFGWRDILSFILTSHLLCSLVRPVYCLQTWRSPGLLQCTSPENNATQRSGARLACVPCMRSVASPDKPVPGRFYCMRYTQLPRWPNSWGGKRQATCEWLSRPRNEKWAAVFTTPVPVLSRGVQWCACIMCRQHRGQSDEDNTWRVTRRWCMRRRQPTDARIVYYSHWVSCP